LQTLLSLIGEKLPRRGEGESQRRNREEEIQKGRRQRERVDCHYLLQSVHFEAHRSEYFEEFKKIKASKFGRTKNIKQANIKRIRSRFAEIRLERIIFEGKYGP
jgi:hypothetical protein